MTVVQVRSGISACLPATMRFPGRTAWMMRPSRGPAARPARPVSLFTPRCHLRRIGLLAGNRSRSNQQANVLSSSSTID